MDDIDMMQTIRGGLNDGMRVFNSRFELVRQLGRGGMGQVWLARDGKLDNRLVALKFLPDALHADAVARDDLKREALKALQLTHPNIVRVHDFFDDGQAAGISMEYVEGRTVSEMRLHKPARAFDVDDIREWIGQLCEALEYAHGEGLVHRDLKPANLMVDGRGRLKVCDFGIARAIKDTFTRTTGKSATAGTLPYMSPQQIDGERPCVADDIYALGATIYELLTGKPPFYSGAIELQVSTKIPPSMAKRREELGVESLKPIPLAWEKVVAQCLAKEPAQRPAGAARVLDKLQNEPASEQTEIATSQPSTTTTCHAASLPGRLKIVVFPSSAKVACYVDDERMDQALQGVDVSTAQHVIRIIPLSYAWGEQEASIRVEGAAPVQHAVKLGSFWHPRSRISLTASVACGGLFAMLGALLPKASGLQWVLPSGRDGTEAYAALGLFGAPALGATLGLVLFWAVRVLRGFHLVLADDFPAKPIFSITTGTAVVAWILGFFLPINLTWVITSISSSTVIGVVFCIIPWHGEYREREVV